MKQQSFLAKYLDKHRFFDQASKQTKNGQAALKHAVICIALEALLLSTILTEHVEDIFAGKHIELADLQDVLDSSYFI